jgi:hypothetical protein
MVAGVVGGAVFVVVAQSDDEAEDALPSPTLPDVTTSTTGEPQEPAGDCSSSDVEITPSGDAEVDATVAEIAAFVEEERCLQFQEPITVELADEGEFQDRLLDDAEEDEEESQDSEDVFRALGFIEPGVDLSAELDSALEGAVLGFYDDETGELVVRSGGLSPLTKTVIAHELVHALDDQHFELHRPEYGDDDDMTEVSTGFTAIVEGNAGRIEDEYRSTLTDEERAAAAEEEAAVSAGVDPDIPEIIFQFIGSPYQLGPVLVQAILDDGGVEALNAAFEDPPTTTEQVLIPAVYLAGEEAVEVEVPAADGEVFDEGAFGAEALFYLVFESAGQLDASEAVLGWGGDAYVAWREGDRTCVRAAFVGDNPQDTDEIADVLTTWATTHDDAQIEQSGDEVQLTACA